MAAALGFYPSGRGFDAHRSQRVVSINSDASVSYTDESGAIPERPIRVRLAEGRPPLERSTVVRIHDSELRSLKTEEDDDGGRHEAAVYCSVVQWKNVGLLSRKPSQGIRWFDPSRDSEGRRSW